MIVALPGLFSYLFIEAPEEGQKNNGKNTNVAYETNDARTKKNYLQQRNNLGTIRTKTTRGCGLLQSAEMRRQISDFVAAQILIYLMTEPVIDWPKSLVIRFISFIMLFDIYTKKTQY